MKTDLLYFNTKIYFVNAFAFLKIHIFYKIELYVKEFEQKSTFIAFTAGLLYVICKNIKNEHKCNVQNLYFPLRNIAQTVKQHLSVQYYSF